MKTFVAKEIVKEIKAGDADFRPETLAKIVKLLTDAIPDSELAEVNKELSQHNKRHITVADIAHCAYVHCRSIKENNGESPYDRIISYCGKHGMKFDKLHVRAMTNALLQMEFLILVNGDTSKGRCRVYALAEDVKAVLFAK